MNRTNEFIELLTARTSDGRVSWQETDFANTYQAKFDKYVVQLAPFRASASASSAISSLMRIYDDQDRHAPRVLQIYDLHNRLIEEIGKVKPDLKGNPSTIYPANTVTSLGLGDIEDENVKYPLRKLYDAIKKQFDEPSAVIDALIKELE